MAYGVCEMHNMDIIWDVPAKAAARAIADAFGTCTSSGSAFGCAEAKTQAAAWSAASAEVHANAHAALNDILVNVLVIVRSGFLCAALSQLSRPKHATRCEDSGQRSRIQSLHHNYFLYQDGHLEKVVKLP